MHAVTATKAPTRLDVEMLVLRKGNHKSIERQAKQWAGGVGPRDTQPWTAPVKTRIDYGPRREFRSARFRPSLFDYGMGLPPREMALIFPDLPFKQGPEFDVDDPAEHLGIPDPEGHRMPEGSVSQVVNTMTFDDQPWLDAAPWDVQAKVGYTNAWNDKKARRNPEPGEYWAKQDGKARNAKQQKASDASQPPAPPASALESLRGRQCRNCLTRMDEDLHGTVRYCSERCRNRRENVKRRGQTGTVHPAVEPTPFEFEGPRVGYAYEQSQCAAGWHSVATAREARCDRKRGRTGTVHPGIELTSFAVDGRRIGIDPAGIDPSYLGFARLLASVA